MSQRNDHIKILELVCSQIDLHLDLKEYEDEVVEISEDILKEDGFSFYEAYNLLDELEFHIGYTKIIRKDNKRFLRVHANSDIYHYLLERKYPLHDLDLYEESQEIYSRIEYQHPITDVIVVIDPIGKIFIKSNESLMLKIRTPSKKFSMISLLLEEERLGLSDLTFKLDQSESVVMRAIIDINKAFKKKLSLQDPLIKRLDTGGYVLNRDKFQIESK